jgi:hypothetical protein
METERDAILRRRRKLRSEFGDLYDRVSAILFKEDPGGVNFEINPDEYESEVDLILPRLPSCTSVADVQAVLYDVLLKMFDEDTVKAPDRLGRIAGLIWTEVSSFPGVRRPTSR